MANNRRRDILRRAAELFASHGVSRTSMEDIASAVGIKREGVYYYFKSRNDILLEIILPQSKSLLLALRRLVRASMAAPLKLRSAIEVHLDAYSPSYIEMSVALERVWNAVDGDHSRGTGAGRIQTGHQPTDRCLWSAGHVQLGVALVRSGQVHHHP